MPRYLIEVSHEDSKEACNLAKLAFYRTGSHFVTHADWGCSDGEHKAWINVELDSKEEAKTILPPAFRSNAKVIELEKIDSESMEQVINKHKG
ncbi:MAG TPA: hypothetical protein VI688_07935 [Anaerolineales bacterium]|nr:hypothetical protein [Anaerolineales bacterium]HLE74160.1 hypothetical protein [Anaerolineales bacterium]